jgi:protein SCO1/2
VTEGRAAAPFGARSGSGRLALVVIAAAVLGVAIGWGLHLALAKSPPRPIAGTLAAAGAAPATYGLHGQATWAPGASPAPAILRLRDQGGRPFALASLRGHPVALTFFDSYCTQACPLEGRAIAAAERSLPAGQRPVLVVVSVNPRDTEASTRAAVRKWGLARVGEWLWLRGTHANLARVWRAYRIFVAPPRNGDISHTEALYLIGRRGDERSAYLYPFATRFVSADMRTLALERRG